MTKTIIIFKNQHYTACKMRDGSLVVTRNNKQQGRRVLPEGAKIWIDSINGAVLFGDTGEANALCRAIVNA